MNPFFRMLSSLLQVLLLFHIHFSIVSSTYTHEKPTIFEALREIGCSKYADFLFKYPTPETLKSDMILFAPTDAAVDAYLAKNPDGSYTPSPFIRRQDGSGNAAANQNNFASGAGGSTTFAQMPSQGIVYSGGGSGDKVGKPPGSAGGGGGGGGSGGSGGNRRKARGIRVNLFGQDTPDRDSDSEVHPVGTVTAGAGVRSNVLQDAFGYDNGVIYKVDSFLAFPVDFSTSLKNLPGGDFNLTYLFQIFDQLPAALEKIKSSPKVTFLAPTYKAFRQSGLDCNSPKKILQAFLDNHTISNLKGFVGYTPSFKDGKCYTTDGSNGLVAKFDGKHTFLNDAKIVGEDTITRNGVIQVIDKVLYKGNDRNRRTYPPSACKSGYDTY